MRVRGFLGVVCLSWPFCPLAPRSAASGPHPGALCRAVSKAGSPGALARTSGTPESEPGPKLVLGGCLLLEIFLGLA